MEYCFWVTPVASKEEKAALSSQIESEIGCGVSWKEADDFLILSSDEKSGEEILAAVSPVFQTAGFRIFFANPPAKPKKEPLRVRLSVFLVSLICMALVCSILAFGFATLLFKANDQSKTLGNTGEDREGYIGKISLVDEFFKQYSLYDVDGNLLLDAMLKAYADATGDKYAAYFTQEEYEQLMEEGNASLTGIGISVFAVENGYQILQVFPSSPAAEAGILPGDILIAVKDAEKEVIFNGENYDSVIQAVRGTEGSEVTVTVLRGETQMEFLLQRRLVETVSVSGQVYGVDASVGIVRITGFDTATPKQLKETVASLTDQGCDYFVYDLRENPGGDLKSVTAVLSYFLNEGDVMFSTVLKDGTEKEYLVAPAAYTGYYADCSVAAEEIGQYRLQKFTVLVNGNTASAAELFTAAIRDYGLAVTVGEQNFGKGIIQSIFNLSEWGYSGGLKLTVAYYCSPNGENFHEKGIAPDNVVEPAAEIKDKSTFLWNETEDNQLSAAVNTVKN